MARNKTREEKIKSSYRLANFKLASEARQEVKDAETFSYLDASYVRRDLLKTVVISLLMIGLIVAAKRYLS